MNQNDSQSPDQRFVKPWSDNATTEAALRQTRTSIVVAKHWAIGWNGIGWQVFYCAIDAGYRLTGEAIDHATFRDAYTWANENSRAVIALREDVRSA